MVSPYHQRTNLSQLIPVIDGDGRKCTLVDFPVPFDPNISNKEQEKVKKYERLAAEVSRMHRVGTHVVPIVNVNIIINIINIRISQ